MSHRPLPDELKERQGTLRKCRVNTDAPTPEKGVPEMPKGLSPAAKREWNDITKLLAELNVLSVIDSKALAAYCESYSQWQIAQKDVRKSGQVIDVLSWDKVREAFVVTDRKKNPSVTVAQEYLKLMKSFLIEFGLTPASRTRLKVNGQPKVKDPLEELLQRRAARNQTGVITVQ